MPFRVPPKCETICLVHWNGMGPEGVGVVDERLRVRGVGGLRVADCSVMPSLPSGNTNGPAQMVGWRAAELILEDRDRPALSA